MNRNMLKLLFVLVAMLCAVLYCSCGQQNPTTVPVSTGAPANVEGEGNRVNIDDKDETETNVKTVNVQNSTWLIIAQDIIRTVKFLYMFTVIIIVLYKLISDGAIKWVGRGR